MNTKPTTWLKPIAMSCMSLLAVAALAPTLFGQTPITGPTTLVVGGGASLYEINGGIPINGSISITKSGGGMLGITDIVGPNIINAGSGGTALDLSANSSADVNIVLNHMLMTGEAGIRVNALGAPPSANSINIALGADSLIRYGAAGANGIILYNTNSAAVNTVTMSGTIISESIAAAPSATGIEFQTTGGINTVTIGSTGYIKTQGATMTGNNSAAVQIADAGAGKNTLNNNGYLTSTGVDVVNMTTALGTIDINSTGTISGVGTDSRAIYATANGTGAINIKATAGLINTTNATGIYAVNTSANAGNITINTTGAALDINSATATGTNGIQATLGSSINNTASDISITTGTGSIKLGAAGDDDIQALNNGTGKVTVDNQADLSNLGTNTAHYGIVAVSNYSNIVGRDGGAVSVTNSGSITTAGGDAIWAGSRLNTDDAVTVFNSGNIISGYRGIYTQTPGGQINVTNSGDITSVSSGIWADGTTGSTTTNNAANINITNVGKITTSGAIANGIQAQTIKGNIILNGAGDITAAGSGAYAIILQSASGSINVNYVGNLSTLNAYGIQAVAGGQQSDVFVHYSGTISTATHGAVDPVGIAAWNGGGSNIGRAMTVITDAGSVINGARGIAAHTAGMAADGARVNVENAATINADRWAIDAHQGSLTSDANVIIASTGNLTTGTTANHDSHAIYATPVGTGNIYIGYKETGTRDGIVDLVADLAPITGTITTIDATSHGINATKITDAGSINIASAAAINTSGSASNGIFAQSTAAAPITITNSGAIHTTGNFLGSWGSDAILSRSAGGNSTITNTGNITIDGLSSSGIYSNGRVDVSTTTANITANMTGTLAINNTGNITTASGHGLYARLGGAYVSSGVTVTGSVTSNVSGDIVITHQTGTIKVDGATRSGIYAILEGTTKQTGATITGTTTDNVSGNILIGTAAKPITGSITATGIQANGIYAATVGTGSITINSTANIAAGSASNAAAITSYGIGAYSELGDSTINAAGNIANLNTAGAGHHGIIARASGTNATGQRAKASVAYNDAAGSVSTAANGSIAIGAASGPLPADVSVLIKDADTIKTNGLGLDASSVGSYAIYAATTNGNATIQVDSARLISTSGTYAYGEYAYVASPTSTGSATIINKATSITTAANNAYGIFARNLGLGSATVVNQGSITTTGNGAHAIHAFTSISVTPDTTTYAIVPGTVSTITTTGNNAHGIYAIGVGARVVSIAEKTNIHTTGSTSSGIFASTGANLALTNGSIHTEGDLSFGARSSDGGTVKTSTLALTNVNIETNGNLSHAAFANYNGYLSLTGGTLSTTSGTFATGVIKASGYDSAAGVAGKLVAQNTTLQANNAASAVIVDNAGTIETTSATITSQAAAILFGVDGQPAAAPIGSRVTITGGSITAIGDLALAANTSGTLKLDAVTSITNGTNALNIASTATGTSALRVILDNATSVTGDIIGRRDGITTADDTLWSYTAAAGKNTLDLDLLNSSQFTVQRAAAGDYTYNHHTTADATSILKLALANGSGTNLIALGTNAAADMATQFLGTLAVGNGAFSLGGTAGSQGALNVSALQNAAALRLDAGNRTTVDGAATLNGLVFNTGTLAVHTSASNGNYVQDLLTVNNHLDATNGGAVEVTLSGTVQNVIPPVPPVTTSLFDQDHVTTSGSTNAYALTQLVAVAASGNVNGVGTQLVIFAPAGTPSVTATSALMQSGTQVANVTYDYMGAVKTDGIYLGYGLTRIDALAGQTVQINNTGATDSTLGAILSGTGNYNYTATGTTIRIGNAASDYTGATTISTGTVVAITNNALGQTSALNLNAATMLDLNGNKQTVHGPVTVNGGRINVGTGGIFTFDTTTTATGALGSGVYVNNGGSINADGTGNITGTIKTTGNSAYGAYVTDNGSIVRASNLTITTAGANAHGVAALSGGNVALTGGSIKTTGAGASAFAITAASGSATTITGSNVAIDVNGHGIATSGNGNSNVTLTGGSLKTGGNLVNATHTSGTATITLSNLTSATTTSGTVLNATGGGTTILNLDKITATGDIIADTTTTANVFLKNATALTGRIDPVNLNIDATSSWTMTATSELNNLAMTAGSRISFGNSANGTTFKKLIVDKNMSGAGTLAMSTNLRNLQGDLLQVAGTFTGTYTLDITNYGGGARTPGGELMIVQANTPATVTLTGDQYRDAGIYRYRLKTGESDPTNWYLSNKTSGGDTPYSDGGTAILNSASLGGVNWFYDMDSLHKRMGDVRQENNAGTQEVTGNVWLRSYGSRLVANNGIPGMAFSQYNYGLTAGIDKAWRTQDTKHTLLTGGFINMGGVQRDFSGPSDGSTQDLAAGLYGTWLHTDGWCADLVFKADRYKHRFDTNGKIGNAQPISGRYNTDAEGLSLELGRQLKRTDGWWIEPSLQTAIVWLNGVNYNTTSNDPTNAVKVRINSAISSLYKGQLRFGRQILDTNWYPYAKVAATYVDNNGGTIYVEDAAVNLPTYDGWRMETGAGVSYLIDKQSQVYFDYEYTKANRYERPWALNLGYRRLW